jgi:hypothetical protein
VRSFSLSRGRANELSRVDAGTASVLLDNRDRRFDPSLAMLLPAAALTTSGSPTVNGDGSVTIDTTGADVVSAPASYVTAAQGWWAAVIKVGFASTVGAGSFAVAGWTITATNAENYTLYFDGASSRWIMRRRAASVNVDVQFGAVAFSAGAILTVVGKWGGGNIGISVDGGSFVSGAASAAAPTDTTFGIGHRAGAIQVNSDVYWFAAGTGTLTDGDAAALHGFGTTGPSTFLDFSEASAVTLLWQANDFIPLTTQASAIRPMNQWWLKAIYGATEIDLFKGYAESVTLGWVKGSEDATALIQLVDEMKVLNLAKLPTTDPPRPTYQDLAMFDEPTGYWPMLVQGGQVEAVVGERLTAVNGGATGFEQEGGIVGQVQPSFARLTGTAYIETPELTHGMSGNAGALGEFTIETWFNRRTTSPASTELLISGPDGIPSHTYTWKVSLNTSSQVVLEVKNTGGTVHTCTSSAVSALVWHHIVGTIESGSLRLYINGTEVDSTAWTGTIEQADNGFKMIVGNAGTDISTKVRDFDEMAFYRFGLTAARVSAHYTAGSARGFIEGNSTGSRMNAVLTAANSIAPSSVIGGVRDMLGNYMVGQSPLDELRRAETAESVDAVLFIAKDGTITFLDADHRSSSPHNTVQATFDDDGTDFPYQDIGLDFSDSFIANEWNVTRTGGLLQTASDATSIAVFFERSQALTDISINDDAEALVIAQDMLAKYKDPLTRITRLEITSADGTVIENVFDREIGDRIRVFRTPPGGGPRLDQTTFIQHISIDGQPGVPWRVVWGLSPL